jgi:Fic family protein
MPDVKHHHPDHMPVSLDYGQFAKELAEAQYALGLLQGSLGRLQNPMHLIGPLIAKEAAVSSKIEGTQSNSSDIYLYDAGGRAAYQDTPVVSNYRASMRAAIHAIQDGQQLSIGLIKSLHEILLKNVRHKGLLGDFRNDKVWIAEKMGDPIEEALYVPPEHVHVRSYIENILEYVDSDGDTDVNIVKAGMAHYQFEAVHPFEDGNGRIGRLLIPLILYYKHELSLPVVYSSGYFEARPDEYRSALRKVDQTGQYEPWIKFFLGAITAQAKETLELVDAIHKLNADLKKKYEGSKSPYIARVIDFLFDKPVFSIPVLTKDQNVSLQSRLTAVRLVELLEKDGVIEATNEKGPAGTKLYAFTHLLDLLS